MPTPDSILERLRKIKALADYGSAGEASNATDLLSKSLKKHGLTLDDLQTDEVRKFTFTWRNSDDRQLVAQLIRQVAGREHPLFRIVGKPRIITSLTPAQYADINAMWEHYRLELRQEYHRLLRVFMIRHCIGPTPETGREVTPMTDSRRAEIASLHAMMMSLRSSSFQKPAARLTHESLPAGSIS